MATPAPAAEQVTLTTLRQHAQRAAEMSADAETGTYRAGIRQMAREVLAILDMNGQPPMEPVLMPSPFG